MTIRWNGGSEVLTRARHVTLVIEDGPDTTRTPMSRRDIFAGLQFYQRRSPLVRVRLECQGEDGGTTVETTEFDSAREKPPVPTAAIQDVSPFR